MRNGGPAEVHFQKKSRSQYCHKPRAIPTPRSGSAHFTARKRVETSFRRPYDTFSPKKGSEYSWVSAASVNGSGAAMVGGSSPSASLSRTLHVCHDMEKEPLHDAHRSFLSHTARHSPPSWHSGPKRPHQSKLFSPLNFNPAPSVSSSHEYLHKLPLVKNVSHLDFREPHPTLRRIHRKAKHQRPPGAPKFNERDSDHTASAKTRKKDHTKQTGGIRMPTTQISFRPKAFIKKAGRKPLASQSHNENKSAPRIHC